MSLATLRIELEVIELEDHETMDCVVEIEIDEDLLHRLKFPKVVSASVRYTETVTKEITTMLEENNATD